MPASSTGKCAPVRDVGNGGLGSGQLQRKWRSPIASTLFSTPKTKLPSGARTAPTRAPTIPQAASFSRCVCLQSHRPLPPHMVWDSAVRKVASTFLAGETVKVQKVRVVLICAPCDLLGSLWWLSWKPRIIYEAWSFSVLPLSCEWSFTSISLPIFHVDIPFSIILANKNREQWFRKLRNARRKVLARVQSFVQLRLDCLDKVKLDRKINRSFLYPISFPVNPPKPKQILQIRVNCMQL